MKDDWNGLTALECSGGELLVGVSGALLGQESPKSLTFKGEKYLRGPTEAFYLERERYIGHFGSLRTYILAKDTGEA